MKLTAITAGFLALALTAGAASAQNTTTVVVEPSSTQVITPEGQKTTVTTETAAPTAVVVEKESVLRDAITGETVPYTAEEEKDMSLRDKVRSKMK